jgi:hypothetical protein
VRRTGGGEEGGRKIERTRTIVIAFFETCFLSVSTFPHTMPFVEVAAGMREAIRTIPNHIFSPHLASTGLHCLVAEVPLALRHHVFVPGELGEGGADVDNMTEDYDKHPPKSTSSMQQAAALRACQAAGTPAGLLSAICRAHMSSEIPRYQGSILDASLGPLTLTVGLILSDRGSFFYLKSAARSLQPENSAAAAGTAGKG